MALPSGNKYIPGTDVRLMRVTVKYFGTLKKEAGRDEETIEIKAQGATADSLVAILEKKIRNLRRHIDNEEILVALNHEYVELSAQIKDGDEVAFFPPVAGG